MNPISRRGFLRQINCAAVGSGALLNTLLNLKLANSLTAQTTPSHKALVCLFLNGGMDSFNFLVPTDSRYNTYSVSRGVAGSEGGLSIAQSSLLPLTNAMSGYGLHPSCPQIRDMVNGTGQFPQKRLSFIANLGTLVQPITKAQYNAWENGNNAALPVPRALFSHSDQAEHWQTAVPQGLAHLTGWVGRAADILNAAHNQGGVSMSISLNGNNVLQVGNQTQPFAITPNGSLTFSSDAGGSPINPLQLKNSTLRSTLDQHYANLLTESFAQITKSSDEAQQYFQAQYESTGASLGATVDALFPASNAVAMTLKAVLKSIKISSQLGLSRQSFFVNIGGWDHHGELLDTHAGMLSTLDTAIGAFQRGLDLLGLSNQVITFSASDFGRTLRSNGRGSDHAWGGNAFVFGGPVDGGKLFGTYPSLALDGSDDVGRGGRMLPSMPIDKYFAELMRWFGVPNGSLSYVLPNISNFYNVNSTTPPIGFVLP
ncbi:MAG: DUF1501 domain-containing protein [Verrucomicrobiales bacterium]|nr:DUF1501 domain-containing protein [Verrucomicrobiales bacterium]